MVVHVELAGHVAVLHEGVVQSLTSHTSAHSQQFGVVLTVTHPCPQQPGVVGGVHVPGGQLAVVGIEAAGGQTSFALQLVEVSHGPHGGPGPKCPHPCQTPGGLFIEMDPVRAGGDILQYNKIIQ